MASGTGHDGSGVDDRWFQVASVTDVVDRTGTRVGRLQPGRRYRAVDITALQVVVPGPDGTIGYVARGAVRLIAGSPAEISTTAATPSHSTTSPRTRSLEPSTGPHDSSQAGPVAVMEQPARSWTRWSVPCAALAVVAAATLWLVMDFDDSNDNLIPNNADLSPSDNLADDSDEAIGGAGLSSVNASGDVAGGELPFRVVEGTPLELEFFPVGFSADFAFGSSLDVESGLLARRRMTVIDLVTGQEVTAALEGYDQASIITSVLDRGSEVWVALANERKILVFDPDCACVSLEIEVGSHWVPFMFEHAGLIWFPDWDGDARVEVVTAMDPVTFEVAGRVVAPRAADIAHGPTLLGNRLWLSDTGRVRELDPASMAIVKTVELGGRWLSGGVESLGSLFFADHLLGLLHAVDPDTGDVRTLELTEPARDNGGRVLSQLVADDSDGFVWVQTGDFELLAVDPGTLDVVHRLPTSVLQDPVLARGHIWLSSGDRLIVVNPITGQFVADLPGPGAPFSLALVNEDTLLLNPLGSPTRATPDGVFDIFATTYLLLDL